MKDVSEDIGYPLPRKPNKEELEEYKNCIRSLYLKGGIPFAVFCHAATTLWKKGGTADPKSSLLKTCLLFFSNTIFGTMLFSPVCYSQYANLYLKNVKKEKEEMKNLEALSSSQSPEGTQPTPRVEDFSYPGDVITQFSETDSSFSSDFTSTKFLEDDSLLGSSDTKARTTTYRELRERNRSQQAKTNVPPPPVNIDSSSTLPPPIVKEEPKEPQRRVMRNKYGDEIE